MKVHSTFTGSKSKKHLIAFSCATALAGFAFIAKPAFAEEAKADNASNLDVTAATTANVETTADLVETKVVEAPATTEKVASTESTTNDSEQATTSVASSETTSETASTTVSESQAPSESASGQTREAVSTDRAASETASVNETSNSETNITGGQYYRDEYGYWHYKDASGKDLTGPQTIDGVQVYFDKENGVQAKGVFAKDPNNAKKLNFYDKDSGELVTNTFREGLTSVGSTIYGETIYAKDWYYLDREGRPLKGPQTLDYVKMYFFPNGAQVKGRFAPDGHYYDKDTGALVTNRYVHIYNWKFQDKYGNPVDNFFIKYPHNFIFGLNDNTIPVDISHYPLSSKDFDCEDYFYYVDVNGDKVTGEQTIDNVPVYFHSDGKQAKGELITVDGKIHYYDANSGARLSNIDITIKGQTYHFDADGNGTLIS